ncbi:serine hydrolase [Candidatus Saccharibacteria bacterium]|nr:serine hydrolase [Candidatus Saccharibacteria bacterium]
MKILNPNRKNPLRLALLIILPVAVMTFALLHITHALFRPPDVSEVDPTPEKPVNVPDPVDFQSVIDDWSASLLSENSDAKIAVKIYDLDLNQPAGALNEREKFTLGTLSPFFSAYEEAVRLSNPDYGYNKDDILVKEKSFTRASCLDLALREGNETCASALLSDIGELELNRLIKSDYGLENSTYRVSTAEDLTKMWQLYMNHEHFSAEVLGALLNTLLVQPDSKDGVCFDLCHFRLGLPAGFSESYSVYNKVGWEITGSKDGADLYSFYHNTALVSRAGRNFLITVLTENLPSPESSLRTLATSLESALSN